MKISEVKQLNKATGKEYTYFVVDAGRINGKRVRYYANTKADAQAKLRTLKRQQEKYGTQSAALSPTQFTIATEAFKMLAEAEANDSVLLDAVADYLNTRKAIAKSIPLRNAFDLYVKTFDAERQELHVRTVGITLKRLIAHFGDDMPVASITQDEIETFFATLGENVAAKTYNNTLTYSKTFFGWCVERGYAKENPIAIKTKRIAYEDPSFIKVDDLCAILQSLEASTLISDRSKHMLINFITLSFFCGIRTSEIFRLPADAVHPEDDKPFVRVSTTKGAARGIKGRIVDLEQNAVEWLKKYPFVAPIKETSIAKLRRRLRKILDENGKPIFDALFVKNVARHSYITYHTAKYRDYARTEAYVGTSASMRCRHYQGLATTAAGEAYFALYPSS